jgi:SAM-dependent methyltransferase
MSTETIAHIQHAYNDVVAPHYDLDPQAVTNNSLDRAVQQIRQLGLVEGGPMPLKCLDLGMGTGLFLAKLKALGGDRIQPFGLDLAANMIANARAKLPDLVAEVDDAANFDAHFHGHSFGLISTHFVTGFVPMTVLAPKIYNRLDEGGYWSLVGGTKEGYPALQAKANSRIVRWLCGAGSRKIDEAFINPANQAEVEKTLQEHGFEVCLAETFEPPLAFRDFAEFMAFAYEGGWFTPLIVATGLDKIGPITRWLLNRVAFPVKDHHSIAIVLARKVSRP